MSDADSSLRHLQVQGARPTLPDSVDLRYLIPGGELVKKPIRYRDEVWDFTGYPFVNQTNYRLDFGGIPPRWRNAVKDWTLLRLNPRLAESGDSGLRTDDVMARVAAADNPLRVFSIFTYVANLARCLTVIERNAGETLGPEDWKRFGKKLAAENPEAKPVTLASYVRPLLSFWSYRGLLGVPDMFGGRPLGGQLPEQVFSVPTQDLNVERPAPEYCGPLLGVSLWIMDNCSEDILARLEVLASTPDISGKPRDEQIQAVTQRLIEWERTGRPLPAVTGLRGRKALTPAWATFVKLTGSSSSALRSPIGEAKKLLERLHRELGVSEAIDGFDLSIGQVPLRGGSRSWIDGLPPTRYGSGLEHWAGILAYCCAVVIVILTTVRDRELAALPHDCLVEGTYDHGGMDVAVTRMRGFLVKNRTVPVPSQWVVGDDVIRAVRTIHRLKSALRLSPRFHPQTGQEVLLHPSLGRTQGRRSGNTLKLGPYYLSRILAGAAHLAERGVMDPLPPMPKWLPHRTLRITGIEAYASQAWGDALAAAQAHWSSRKVAEGYLGHLPRSVYIADPESVEEVRLFSIGQTLLDVASDTVADPMNVAGKGSGRLDAVLTKANAVELLTGPVTNSQIMRIAKSNPNVSVGELTICVFGPGGLCGDGIQADFKLCRPFACRNSATTRAQRARIELRRRGWRRYTGVFERARLKIEADLPGLVGEFEKLTDRDLRELILADLPGRSCAKARESRDDEQP